MRLNLFIKAEFIDPSESKSSQLMLVKQELSLCTPRFTGDIGQKLGKHI